MTKTLIYLIGIAVLSAVLEVLVLITYNRKIDRAGLKISGLFRDKTFARKYHKVFRPEVILVMVGEVLIGVADMLLKDLAWLWYVGLGVAVVYGLFCLYRFIDFYVRIYTRRQELAYRTPSLWKCLTEEIVGRRSSAYILCAVLAALVWALVG